MRDLLARNNETFNALDGLLAQVAVWEKRTDNESIREAAKSVTDKLRDFRPKLIDVNMKQSQLWPSGLHEKLNAMMDALDGSDYAPPQQFRDVFAEHTAELDGIAARLQRSTGPRWRR